MKGAQLGLPDDQGVFTVGHVDSLSHFAVLAGIKHMVLRRLSMVVLAFGAGCEGLKTLEEPDAALESDGPPGDAASDATADASSNARIVPDQEPNNDPPDATVFPAGGGEFVIQGTLGDDIDIDYFRATPVAVGMYRLRLEWQAGAFAMELDPNGEDADALPGAEMTSMTSPIEITGQVSLTAGPAQLDVSCSSTVCPTTTAYTLYVTLPQ